jgi:hypothetical protein
MFENKFHLERNYWPSKPKDFEQNQKSMHNEQTVDWVTTIDFRATNLVILATVFHVFLQIVKDTKK